VENGPYFAFCGNNGPVFFNCRRLGFGTHTVTATPYAGKNATGLAGPTVSTTFTIKSEYETLPSVLAVVPLSSTSVNASDSDVAITMAVTVQSRHGIVTRVTRPAVKPELPMVQPNLFLAIGRPIVPLVAQQPLDRYGFPMIMSGDGGPGITQTFNFTLTVPQHSKPGVYNVTLAIGDVIANAVQFYSLQNMPDLNFAGITVVEAGAVYDSAPPVLLNATMTPAVITVFQDTVVTLVLTVSDNDTGIALGRVRILSPGKAWSEPTTFLNEMTDLPLVGNGVLHTFTVEVFLSYSMLYQQESELQVVVDLFDPLGNNRGYTSYTDDGPTVLQPIQVDIQW
jgi:hypothetical protein